MSDTSNAVNHPPHYNHGGIEVIDIIEAWGLGFCLGNAVKYVLRAPYKGNAKQDYEKALWYLDRLKTSIDAHTKCNKKGLKKLTPFQALGAQYLGTPTGSTWRPSTIQELFIDGVWGLCKCDFLQYKLDRIYGLRILLKNHIAGRGRVV